MNRTLLIFIFASTLLGCTPKREPVSLSFLQKNKIELNGKFISVSANVEISHKFEHMSVLAHKYQKNGILHIEPVYWVSGNLPQYDYISGLYLLNGSFLLKKSGPQKLLSGELVVESYKKLGD